MKSTRSQSAKKKAPAKRGPKSDYVIQTWTGNGTQPFFARLASSHNGQPLATSEGYATKQKRTKTWAPIAERLKCEIVEIETPPVGQPSAPASAEGAAPAPVPTTVPTEERG